MTMILDVKGLACPLPVLRAKKALKLVEMDGLVELHATDPGTLADIPTFCRQTGHELVDTHHDADTYIFLLRRKV